MDSTSMADAFSGIQGFEDLLRPFSQHWRIYVAGGPVRDVLLGRKVRDLDVVVPEGAIELARLAADRAGGTLVILHEEDEVARVVLPQGLILDFSSFRAGSTIEEDLAMRDFTINAMAVPFEDLARLPAGDPAGDCDALIDPWGGLSDLRSGLIRAVRPENLLSDPLRMLRAFRFMAELAFTIEEDTASAICTHASLIARSAPERIGHELDIMMGTERAGKGLKAAYHAGLLAVIIPEIKALEGVDQPGFHHLDVLDHCLEAVSCMDRLCMDPSIKFHSPEPICQWLDAHEGQIHRLKWAALFHDFGKPAKKGVRADGRVTFYEHDREGAEQARAIGRRLRWSRQQTDFVSRLVRLHMRPFHLLGDFRKGRLTKRAMRRLLKDIGQDYPALFLLAMSDSMAGVGPLKPKDLDSDLSRLFSRIHAFYLDHVRPVKEAPRLVTGRDVMETLGIGPGPLVGEILDRVEAARIEGRISNRQEALVFIRSLRARTPGGDAPSGPGKGPGG